jgi:hypothetical protein
MRSVTPHPRRSLGLVVVIPVVLAACSASGATPGAATQLPAPATPVGTASPVATVSPTPAATAAAAESPAATASGGPVDYAAWVERQGFGGSSGLNEVAKETRWMRDNPTAVTAFDIQTTQRLIDHLATWLDENPPTACWADYHDTVRATLGRMHDAYVTAHDTRAAGYYVPTDVVAALVSDADAAYGMAEPPGC